MTDVEKYPVAFRVTSVYPTGVARSCDFGTRHEAEEARRADERDCGAVSTVEAIAIVPRRLAMQRANAAKKKAQANG